jgi:hypothetical protein
MALSLYPQIKINSLYLTSTGANGGTPYIATVSGLDALAVTSANQVIKSLNGTPYLQITEDQLGKPISIEFPKLLTADYAAVVAEIQDAIDNTTTLSLDITDGDYGDFSLTVVPDENPVRFPGEFQNGKLLNVAIHFLTT